MHSGKKERIDASLIIFDLDGTLIDSSHDIAWSANMTLKSMGYEKLDMEVIKESIGWGVKSLLEKLMPNEAPDVIEAARKRFLEFYGGHLVVDTYVYPGVMETLLYLSGKGKRLSVITNKPVGLANSILEELGMSRFFSLVLGGDSLPNRKPHPEPLEKAMSALGVDGASSVIVGDSPIDCEAGKRAGIGTVGVTYGFRGQDELERAGCDFIIDNLTEIRSCIKD